MRVKREFDLEDGDAGDLNRRGFVAVAGAIMASFASRPADAAETIGTVMKSSPIGVQLYSVRDEMKKDFAGTLAHVARIGYKEVEFAGYFDQPAKTVRSILNQNGLTAPSAHVGFPELGPKWDKIIEDAQVIGHKYLICPWIDEKLRTADGFHETAELFNKAGEQTKKAGIQFGYHNHDFEFKPIDGKLPYDMLIQQTDADKVIMEMDVYWVTSGGADPLAYFRRFPGRFPLLHLKDMDASKKMVDVGKGTINWKAVLAGRRLAGTKHVFVEHDQPPDPFASIRNSYNYLRRIGA